MSTAAVAAVLLSVAVCGAKGCSCSSSKVAPFLVTALACQPPLLLHCWPNYQHVPQPRLGWLVAAPAWVLCLCRSLSCLCQHHPLRLHQTQPHHPAGTVMHASAALYSLQTCTVFMWLVHQHFPLAELCCQVGGSVQARSWHQHSMHLLQRSCTEQPATASTCLACCCVSCPSMC